MGDGHSSFPGKGGFCFHVYLLVVDWVLFVLHLIRKFFTDRKTSLLVKGLPHLNLFGTKIAFWQGGIFFRATPAVTQDLGSAVSIEGQPLLHSPFLRQARSIKNLILPGPQIYRSYMQILLKLIYVYQIHTGDSQYVI